MMEKTIFCCATCAEEGVTKDYPFCCQACELEYLATHYGEMPKALTTSDGRMVGLLIGMGF